MAAPARNDSADHLLITAHLYWLTGGDGEGSKVIQYMERQPRIHTKTKKYECVLHAEDRGRELVNQTHEQGKGVQDRAYTPIHTQGMKVKMMEKQLFEFCSKNGCKELMCGGIA